jgi:hypothetical protein
MHHKRAKKAINFIIQGLKAAAGSVDGDKGVDSDFSVDTNRASRIIFVSGEPGSGKSSLYLTLRAMLSSKEKGKYQLGYKGGLNELEGVRWLDALDLEVASDEGENLLAAVLVRLIEVLTDRDTVSNTVHSKPCDDAIKDLEELATDIGIAWEGNLHARAGALDPDTYSEEVMRAQRARLGVNERLRRALDKLAENNCHGCSERTLFVLPVDDLYLKPDVSLQLLRLLRMISIPRLFFLIMGDIKTVEALFIEKSLADWTGVAGTRLFAARSERLDGALTRARELRARYLRKLLPPLQRTMIEPMDWHEALYFEPGRPDASVDPLEELLADVKLDKPFGKESNERGESLLNFLISPPLPAAKEERHEEREKRQKRAKGEEDAKEETPEEIDLKKLRSAYTALQILDATPREMMDLGSALREVISGGTVDNGKTPLLLSSVRDMVNLVSEEQSFLSEKEQEVLGGIIPTRSYGDPEDINFAIDRLCLHPSQRTWKKHQKQAEEAKKQADEEKVQAVADEQNSRSLWTRDHRSWDLTVNRKFINDSKKKSTKRDESESIEQAVKDPFAKLPPRPAAWFVLLHDIAWMWKPDSITENLVKKLCEELNEWKAKMRDKGASPPNQECGSQLEYLSLIKTEQSPDPSGDFPGWAVWFDGHNYEHFPMPAFETFGDLDRFLYIWSRGLNWLEEHRKLADQAHELAIAAKEKASAARREADEAKARAEAKAKAEDVAVEEKADAVTAQSQAEAIAVQKETDAVTAQRQADEAGERVGANEPQRISKLIHLWGLAGSTVLDKQYKEFKPRDSNWFEQGLRNFTIDGDKNQMSKDWRDRIEAYRLRMINP